MKILKTIAFVALLSSPASLLAQGDLSYNILPADDISESPIPTDIPMDSIIVREFDEYSAFYRNLDSLGHSWFVQQANAMRFSQEDYWDAADSAWRNPGPIYPDSIYIHRLANIESVIDLTYNEQVKAYIHVYTQKKREKLSVLLGLADYYFPIFEHILLEFNLPVELKYLAIIESALNPNATSRMGATGLWQFMYGTGKVYKLEINSDVDQRRDPIQSTYAAATYLRDLYAMFGDWTLALAAYNCGPGNVKKAIARSGGKTNFWDIYYKLPKETRGYVPAFIGATYAMHYYKDHGIYPMKLDMSLAVDTLHVSKEIHFGQISEVLQVPIELIQTLNPQYKRDIIPAKLKNYSLVLPVEHVIPFIQLEDSIYNHKRDIFFDPSKRHLKPANSVAHGEIPSNANKVVYKVKSGDNLGYIASKYDVKVTDLRKWNNIGKNNLIRAGQNLVIYVSAKS
jgi:membrane-bound lytic murein transglycosylase D